jgi:outer membrane beta-barrel protein
MKTSFLILGLLLSTVSARADIMEDFDNLGGNDVLMEKAKALEPDANISVVQDRVVNRFRRFEVSPEFASVLGGDSYLNTRGYGVNAHFHINPHWSLGVKYNSMTNELSPEGKNLINDSGLLGKNIVPEMDYPKDQVLATVSFYPIYGKLNMFNKGIAHFDVYALAGGGNINLRSGSKSTLTAGGGVGFWVSQHLTTRFEMRYQTYDTQRTDGNAKIDLTVASLQMGYLL